MARELSLCFGVVLLAAAAPHARSVERGENLLTNGGFERREAGWKPYGGGFAIDEAVAHSGRRSLRCTSPDGKTPQGVLQVLTFEKPIKHPFRVSGWSRASDARVGQDYDIYLDVHYADGTPLWGRIARFRPGTHGWQYAEHVFHPAKPVKTIQAFVFIRKTSGTVWFDDVRVELLPFELRRVRVLPGLYGGISLGAFATTSLPASWKTTLEGAGGTLARHSGSALPVQFHWHAPDGKPGKYTVRAEATDRLLGETIRMERTMTLSANTPSVGYAVWTESSMVRVLPHALPDRPVQRPSASISLAGHEYESFQIVLLAPPGSPLKNVEVELGDLVCDRTGARIPARHIEWHQVGYVRISKIHPHPHVPDAAPGWWPDPLLPVERFDVPPSFAQPIWVTVYAPKGTPAGEYRGSVTVRPRGKKPVSVAVRATVYGFDLPVQGHMKTAFALMDGFLERVYGKPLSAELRQKYGDFVLRHRLNPDDISRTSPPALDDLLHYRDRGLKAYNVLNMVEERGNRTWVCWSPKKVYTPAFKRRLAERLDPYVAQLRKHKLIDKAYIYTFDERGKDFWPVIREYFGMVKQRYPGIRTLTTAKVPQDPKVMRELNIDWNCPLTAAYRFDQAEECRAAGLQVWAYVCLGPRYPYANWLADDPLIEARVIWWQAFHQKMDGFLYWGLNIWGRKHNDKPIDPAAGPLLDWSITTGGRWPSLHGDGELLYAGTDGPIGSIRLANIRDGLEDYEYLWLLSHRAGDLEAGRRACLPVTTSLTDFTRDPKALTAQRHAIARKLGMP